MATQTYVPISSQTLGSAAASVTFSSIPSTYTDLVLVISGRSTATAGNNNSQLILNGDNGSNYSMTRLTGDGTSPASDRVSNGFYAGWAFIENNTNSNFTPIIYHIQNYANTTTYKTVIGRGAGASNFISAAVSMWRSTAAINSIYVGNTGGNFVAGSTFTIYGIKAA